MDEQATKRRWEPFLWSGVVLAALAAVAAIVALWWRRHRGGVERSAALPGRVPLGQVPPGLTEEQAAARWSEGQDNAVHLKPPRTQQQIWRENVYTIFNLSLVGLALTQLFLQQWLNALLSLGTIALNVGLHVGQEMLAMRRLAEFQRSARPRATVVREGKTRSIDPNRVVRGDVLIVGPGDQFLVDGQAVGAGRMVVDESAVTDKRRWITKRAGEPVYAGSFCISGRGAYVAQKVGDERLIISRLGGPLYPSGQVVAEELTPLERLVDRILRALMVLVAVFAILLLIKFFRLDLGVPVDLFNDAASVIFNIAPSGLFLMIIVTYTTGTADLARLGALVHRARSVESLAEATVICFAEAGILAGTLMELQPIQDPEDPEHLPESRLRQILGDYGRSTSAPDLATRILTDTFEGNRRTAREEAPFLTALGWSAITFDEPDLRGVYVLAEPPILDGHLLVDVQEAGEKEKRSPAAAVRRLVSPLGRLFQRGDKAAAEEAPPEEAPPEAPETGGDPSTEAVDAAQDPEGDEKSEPFFRRWAERIGQRLRRAEPEPEQSETAEAADVPEAALLFAYLPEPLPLRDDQGNVQLPEGLIPLCELRYAQSLRPEAIDIVKAFARTGVSIKAFASSEPDQILTLFQRAELVKEDKDHAGIVGTISGHDLEQLPQVNPGTPGAEWVRAATENSVFGHITPAQAGALVRALRQSGELVAVVGDGVTDLPALQQANLAIARQTSSQAALSVADIVMMGSSPSALLQVLYKGQRIVHGLLDVLKLNLVQVFYLTLLIVAIQVVSVGFPYASAQGSATAAITVTLPSAALSFWAATGRSSSERFGQILARFVAPAAVSMSLAALLVYVYFLDRTGQLAIAQLAVTYTLIYAGLLLAVLVKPPWHPRRGEADGAPKRDWRMAGLALFLGVTTFFLPAIPLAQKYLKLDWLQQPADYGIVGLAVVGWALVLNLAWWLLPPATASSPAERQPVGAPLPPAHRAGAPAGTGAENAPLIATTDDRPAWRRE